MLAKSAGVLAGLGKVGFYGLDVYEINQRQDMSGNAKLAAASLKLLPGAGLVDLVAPGAIESFSKWFASIDNPLVDIPSESKWLQNIASHPSLSWLDHF